MKIDWDQLQKDLSPMRSFEDLGSSLRASFSYRFVQELFNFPMEQIQQYTLQVLGGDFRQRYTAYLAELTGAFQCLKASGVKDLCQLVEAVQTRAAFAVFCENCAIEPRVPLSALKFLVYWFVPTQKYLRELTREDVILFEAIAKLRECGLRYNLDLLDQGRTPAGRAALVAASGVSLTLLTGLVHRADFSRLPWASKATISNFVGAGYASLRRLTSADAQQLSDDFYRYGQSIAKNLKHGNEIDNAQRIARLVPRIVIEDSADDPVR